MDAGISHVFQPNPVPENYSDRAAIPLVLRPQNFCDNARDVANLLAYVKRVQPRYKEIIAPTIIITGDSDGVVYEEIHSRGLKRDIAGSELYSVRNLGCNRKTHGNAEGSRRRGADRRTAHCPGPLSSIHGSPAQKAGSCLSIGRSMILILFSFFH
jgi:hypothetical protein